MTVKYWDGTAWVEIDLSAIQSYDGASFNGVNDVSVYDGTQFVSLYESS